MAMSVQQFSEMVYGFNPEADNASNKEKVEKSADNQLGRLDKYIGQATVIQFIEENLTRLYMEALFNPAEANETKKLTDPRVIALGMFLLGMRCEQALAKIEELNEQFEV